VLERGALAGCEAWALLRPTASSARVKVVNFMGVLPDEAGGAGSTYLIG
jgi:hypothetical protein